MLSFYHRIISDPNQSPSDKLSDLKIILSPVRVHWLECGATSHLKIYRNRKYHAFQAGKTR